MGSFSTSFSVYGASSSSTNTYNTGYNDTDHKLCNLTVEGCQIITDGFAQHEDCEDTTGLSISPSLYGGDGTLAVTFSNSDNNRAFNIKIDMSWVDKDEDCPSDAPAEDPCSGGGNTCLEAEIYGDPHITTFDGKTYLL